MCGKKNDIAWFLCRNISLFGMVTEHKTVDMGRKHKTLLQKYIHKQLLVYKHTQLWVYKHKQLLKLKFPWICEDTKVSSNTPEDIWER